MKTIAIALSAAALLASAHASAEPSSNSPRVQVTGARAEARAPGLTYASGDLYSGTHFEVISTKTRAQVRAELAAARQRGELTSGEQYPFAPETRAQGKTRAEVKAELAAYRLAHRDARDEPGA